MSMISRLLLLVVLLLVNHASLAWSKQGHQIVGELAERQLSPGARAEVQALLAGEAGPTLAGISTWADELRDNGTALGERSSRWHFVKFPRGQSCAYAPARDCPDGDCVIAAINAQQKILAERSQSLAARKQALKFLVHFVGDVHQPLHAGFADDRGGNDYQLNYNNEGTNLHGLWDYRIVHSAGLETSAYVDRLLTADKGGEDKTFAADNPAAAWAFESCALVHAAGFYPAKGTLEESYLDKNRATVDRRLREAGDRLAVLLESALATPALKE